MLNYVSAPLFSPLSANSMGGGNGRARRDVSEALLSDPEEDLTLQMVFHTNFPVSCSGAFLGR